MSADFERPSHAGLQLGLRELGSHAEVAWASGRGIAAFDIETIPDPALGRTTLGFTGDDADIIQQMFQYRLEKTNGASSLAKPPFHKVVQISIVRVRDASEDVTLIPLTGVDERQVLEDFVRLVNDGDDLLVSWNGRGFDLPVIRHRCLLHGLPCPALQPFPNNVQPSNATPHLDLMQVLANNDRNSYVSLQHMARTMGLPGKTLMSGDEVHEYYLRGDLESIARYCLADALVTLLLFLAWQVVTGLSSPDAARDSVTNVRNTLENESDPYWHDFSKSLMNWPPVLSRHSPTGP